MKTTIGDLGAVIGAAWEGLGHWTPFNTEVKAVDTSQAATNCSNSGVIACLSQTAQGNNFFDRQGLSIKAVALELRTVCQQTGANSAMREIVFIDWDNQGATPTLADLLSVSGTAEAPLSPFFYKNRERFEILSDRLFELDTVQNTLNVHVDKFRLDTHVKYLGTTAVAASNGEGSIFVALVSQASAVYPTVEFYARLHYVDN